MIKNLYKQILCSAAVILIPAISGVGSAGAANVLDVKYSIEDSAIVFPESFETGSQKLLERWYLKNYTSADPSSTSDYDPGATPAEMKARLAALPTVIEMPYNDIVRQCIERYTKRGRKQLTALLGLAGYYMPIFEQELESAGLPLELKYLPVIESALDPEATSQSGAAGLWQFMIASAKGYDMEVNSVVDERRDPFVSTRKACRYLKDLYDTYGDWSLAIAAYNCGPGTVNKALARAGGNPGSHDFWSIYFYLPEQTRGYVPLFIAANYAMTYYPEHNISPVLATKPLITDTICLNERVHFNQIAAVLDIPVEEIRILNPQFRADVIPASASKTYNLILPSQQIHAYIVSEPQILAYERDKYSRKTEAEPGIDPGTAAEEVSLAMEEAAEAGSPVNPADPAPAEAAAAEVAYEETHPQEAATPHRRRTAESETSAKQSAASAKKAETASTSKKNETASSSSTKKNEQAQNTSKKKETAAAAKPQTHVVKSGENLTVIARKYGVTVAQLQSANPKINADKLHPGDKITIPAKGSTGKSGSKKRKR